MASIRFNLKRARALRSTAIVAVIRHEGQRAVRSTGLSTAPPDWDTKRERSKSDEATNMRLSEIRENVLHYIKASGRIPDSADLSPVKKVKAERVGIVNAVLARGAEVKQMRQGKSSDRIFKTLASNLRKFLAEQSRREVFLDEVGRPFIAAFSDWLNGRNLAQATVHKNMWALLHTIKRFGSPEQYSGVLVPTAKSADQVYLTPDEIAKLEALQFPEPCAMSRTRDLFLCAYYTALRFCDWPQIRLAQIETHGNIRLLRITQQKTKEKAIIPANPKLIEILETYGGRVPDISGQHFNRTIKKVCELAGITERVPIAEYRQGRVIITEARKCDLVSSHTARRSFATNAVAVGKIPATDVMRFTGHSTMSAFLQYVRTTKEETALQYAKHPFFSKS